MLPLPGDCHGVEPWFYTVVAIQVVGVVQHHWWGITQIERVSKGRQEDPHMATWAAAVWQSDDRLDMATSNRNYGAAFFLSFFCQVQFTTLKWCKQGFRPKLHLELRFLHPEKILELRHGRPEKNKSGNGSSFVNQKFHCEFRLVDPKKWVWPLCFVPQLFISFKQRAENNT